MPIRFFSEDVPFKITHPRLVIRWLKSVAQAEQSYITNLNFVFCSDDYLLDINQSYLQHDYLTDIITFNNSDKDYQIEGDIFISVERVRENTCIHHTVFSQEIHRVMVHGVLHLVGYDDKSENDRLVMRQKEDLYLSLYVQ